MKTRQHLTISNRRESSPVTIWLMMAVYLVLSFYSVSHTHNTEVADNFADSSPHTLFASWQSGQEESSSASPVNDPHSPACQLGPQASPTTVELPTAITVVSIDTPLGKFTYIRQTTPTKTLPRAPPALS
ncbi:hypothetical protein [Parendozoicomonas haliclonae]|uniref:hypothetical protein n=1 Tax=Parendozoicomonas haliclonae TaxID=1960125 RepID=UPI00105493E6|nr:hypothetical protein [Parendozoicomonas haliclonae]